MKYTVHAGNYKGFLKEQEKRGSKNHRYGLIQTDILKTNNVRTVWIQM